MLSRAAEPEAGGRVSKAESTALFLRRPSTGRLWFNTRLIRSSRYQRQYRWAGWLLGQCFANRTSLHIPFPELLFEKLLQGSDFTVGSLFINPFCNAHSAELTAVPLAGLAAAAVLGHQDVSAHPFPETLFRMLLQGSEFEGGCPVSIS